MPCLIWWYRAEPAKKQGYFIVYGNKLAFQRSYFGTMAVAMQVDSTIQDIIAEVVYEGDTFKYKINRGKKEITEHEQALENINGGKIKAAYSLVINNDGEIVRTEIMTIDEIKKAWAQSQMKPIDEKGNIKAGTTHEKFTAEMCKKTVINRTCKPIINRSSDANLLRAFSRTDEVIAEENAAAEIAENANKEVLDIEYEITEPEPETQATQAEEAHESTDGGQAEQSTTEGQNQDEVLFQAQEQVQPNNNAGRAGRNDYPASRFRQRG